MTTFRNDAKGSRGILLTSGSYVMVDPGQTKTVPGDKVRTFSAGLTQMNPSEASPRAAEGGDAAELPAPPSSITALYPASTVAAQFDHDDDGKPGGSKPHEPPALSGMRKDELIAQAGKEGLIVEQIKGTGANGNVIADDIRAAIEAKRAAKN